MAKLTGKILHIYPTAEIPSKTPGHRPFHKREFVIAVQVFDRDTGEPTIEDDNTPVLAMTGERCSQLDSLIPGQMVTVSYNIRGRRYRDDGGKEKIMTDINVISVSPVRGQATVQSVTAETPQPATAIARQPDIPDELPF